MEIVNDSLILLTASIFLALIIERSMEILKSIFDYLEIRFSWIDFWNRRAMSLQQRFENRIFRNKGNDRQKMFLHLASSFISTDHPSYEGALVISAIKVRTLFLKSSFKALGVVLGILVALWADINFFDLIDKLNDCAQCRSHGMIDAILRPPYSVGNIFSGVAIGLGSGPAHKLIAALESARKKRQEINV